MHAQDHADKFSASAFCSLSFRKEMADSQQRQSPPFLGLWAIVRVDKLAASCALHPESLPVLQAAFGQQLVTLCSQCRHRLESTPCWPKLKGIQIYKLKKHTGTCCEQWVNTSCVFLFIHRHWADTHHYRHQRWVSTGCKSVYWATYLHPYNHHWDQHQHEQHQ